jgi:hypothetical protein
MMTVITIRRRNVMAKANHVYHLTFSAMSGGAGPGE